MKNRELFEKTVGILVDAYKNGTLRGGEACGCAVGNMVAANMGYKVIARDNSVGWVGKGPTVPVWILALKTNGKFSTRGDGEAQLASTGYPPEDLNRIELAFEGAVSAYRCAHGKRNTDGERLSGLNAVYEVLCDIHDVTAEDLMVNPFERKEEVEHEEPATV